jgi:hypothetical protein
VSNSAFYRCPFCAGEGFLRHGSLPDQTFDKCRNCEGCGQTYLRPVRADQANVRKDALIAR